MSKSTSSYTEKQIKEELWRRGILKWKLHETQKKMYDDIENSSSKKYVINSSRRLGKSYLLCLIAIEKAFQNPGMDIKFAAPTQKMVRKIIAPLFKEILKDCPQELRPQFRSFDGEFLFYNDSVISIAGTEMSQIDNLRGQACDLFLCDEAGFCSDLGYVLESVIMPQTLTRPNARVVLASTPPVSPDHKFVEYAHQAMADGCYSKYTIYDNPMLTRETIETYKQEAGGEKTTDWQREYLAEFVTDTEYAIFPEANSELVDQIVFDSSPPEFYLPFTAIDLGYVDNTGALFGYYDFLNAKIVIQDELLVNKITSKEIVDRVREKEAILWNTNSPKARVIDGNAMQIADLNEIHQFACFMPAKSDLNANVNRTRMDLVEQRIIINPKCKNLIAQIQYATWDKNKTKFSRSSDNGHWDLVAALIYFCKHVDRNTNPIPVGHGYDPHNTWNIPKDREHKYTNMIKSMFPTLRKK